MPLSEIIFKLYEQTDPQQKIDLFLVYETGFSCPRENHPRPISEVLQTKDSCDKLLFLCVHNESQGSRQKKIDRKRSNMQTDRQADNIRFCCCFFSSQKHSTVEGDSIILVINEARNEGPCTELILLP